MDTSREVCVSSTRLDCYWVGCTVVWLRSSGWSAQSPRAVHGFLESLFATIHTNLRQDLTPVSTHDQLIHLQQSSDSTHSITFQSSDSNYSFPFKNSGSIHASGLLALVPSGPRVLPHPGFVPYPIPGLWFDITYLLRYSTTQHVFLPSAGFNPPDFFFLLSPCDPPVSCCFATSVVRSRSTGWPSALIHFDEFRPKSLIHSQEIGLDISFPPTNSDSTHSSLSWQSLDSYIHFQQFRIDSLSHFQEFILDFLNQYQRSTQHRI